MKPPQSPRTKPPMIPRPNLEGSDPRRARVWAIADLHLAGGRPGPTKVELAASRWRDHARKVEAEWRRVVAPRDVVLLPGDVSEARNHREVQRDLAWLDRLPGSKVLSAGNHDAWWNGAAKVRPMLRRSLSAVGGDAERVGGVIVCGTLGALPPRDEGGPFLPELARELETMRSALESARALQTPDVPIYALWHYPPFDVHRRPGPVVALLEAAGVTACVYGHLHRESDWTSAVQGVVGGVRYHCVAADAIGFRPLRIDRD